MKIQIHLEGKNRAELVKGLQAHLELLSGKAAKAPKAEEEEANFGETETEEEETEETEEEETEEESEDPTLELSDVQAALQKYAKKFGRETTQAKLESKFKVKDVRKMKPAQFEAAIAAFTVKKNK